MTNTREERIRGIVVVELVTLNEVLDLTLNDYRDDNISLLQQ